MKKRKDKIVAIVPAAGLGKRFGEDKKKTLYLLSGKPVLVWVLETLQGIDEVSEVVPVLKKEDIPYADELIKRYRIKKVKSFVIGGNERQDSVYNAIKSLDKDTKVVIIHDGVRPLVGKDVVKRAIKGLDGCDGVIAGVPVKDTIKEVRKQETEDKGVIVSRTLNRSILWMIQTPQVFHFEKIKKAYESAMADGYYATDDSALVERYGGNVKVIMGSYTNIKITTPEDINIAEAIIKDKF